MSTQTQSCLKVRCPNCKGRTRLAAEAFAELRRRPQVGIDHTCEHCGHRFAATLLATMAPAAEQAPIPAPVPTPMAPPIPTPAPVFEAKPADAPVALPPPPPAAVPFAPRSAPATSAPPFGLLGERNPESPARPQEMAPMGSPPPFAAGAALNPPREGKQSLNDWWKSQSPKRQWMFLGCFAMIIGAGIMSIDGDDASTTAKGKGKKAAVKKKEGGEKAETSTEKSTKESTEKETVATEAAADSPMGLLCLETSGIGGKSQQPLAAAWAVEGKGFVARGAKVFADLQNAGGSTSRWVINTQGKRYKVTGVKFHPDFPVEKLKALIAKAAQQEIIDLVKSAERADVALLETTEAPTNPLKLARDPATISGKPLVISTPVDPKATKAGQTFVVKFATQPLASDMLKDEGAGLSFTMAPGVDAVVTTKDGMLVAFVPRRNTATDPAAVHAIIPAETLSELLGKK